MRALIFEHTRTHTHTYKYAEREREMRVFVTEKVLLSCTLYVCIENHDLHRIYVLHPKRIENASSYPKWNCSDPKEIFPFTLFIDLILSVDSIESLSLLWSVCA